MYSSYFTNYVMDETVYKNKNRLLKLASEQNTFIIGCKVISDTVKIKCNYTFAKYRTGNGFHETL